MPFFIISVRWRNENNATKIQTFNFTQQSNLRIGQIPEEASQQILSHSNSDSHKERKKINKPKRTKQQSLDDTGNTPPKNGTNRKKCHPYLFGSITRIHTLQRSTRAEELCDAKMVVIKNVCHMLNLQSAFVYLY